MLFKKVCSCIVWQVTFKSVQNRCINKNILTPFSQIRVKEDTQCKSSDKAALAGQILRKYKPACLSGYTSLRMNPTMFKNPAAPRGGRIVCSTWQDSHTGAAQGWKRSEKASVNSCTILAPACWRREQLPLCCSSLCSWLAGEVVPARRGRGLLPSSSWC